MLKIGRRSFLGLVAASAGVSYARSLSTVGVQLYTVRTIIGADPLGVLRSIEQIGYKEVELSTTDLDRVSAALKQTSLKPVSLHLDAALFTSRTDGIPAAIDDAAKRGLQWVVCPFGAPTDAGHLEVVRKLGDALNKAGETARRAGLRLAYHNHAFDFTPAGGGTLLDALLATADPKLVSLELDIMWAKVAGVDPVSVLKKYGSRVAMLHLKNLPEGAAQRYDQNVPRTAFREVGNGVIDIPAVLAAAAQTGVQHYFVEQDQTPGNPLVSLRESYDYLHRLNF
ncbi:MAG: sugar phosphate isomerase/epimerase [Bryobacteraceae bacterium]|jgi:sugar phosphate isomerase/epimerase